MRWAALCLAFGLLSTGALAQDERRISSPNGHIEFRILIAGSQEDTTLSRLAYQLFEDGKPLVETSFLGLDIYQQEPILGENVGLIGYTPRSTPKFHAALLEYMQNGSTGRRIDIEVRVFDAGVAFRYIVPKSNMLESIAIDEELTEFRIAGFPPAERVTLPVKIRAPRGTLEIAEARAKGWPAMSLTRRAENLWVSALSETRDKPEPAFTGPAPVTCSWRVISTGPASTILSELDR